MRDIQSTLESARQIYGKPLNALPESTKLEAIRFCVANDLSISRAAREFGVSREAVIEACKSLATE